MSENESVDQPPEDTIHEVISKEAEAERERENRDAIEKAVTRTEQWSDLCCFSCNNGYETQHYLWTDGTWRCDRCGHINHGEGDTYPCIAEHQRK